MDSAIIVFSVIAQMVLPHFVFLVSPIANTVLLNTVQVIKVFLIVLLLQSVIL